MRISNLTRSYRACVVVAYSAVACAVFAIWWPVLLAPAALGVVTLWMLDRPYDRFFSDRRGLGYAIAWFPIHVLHHLSNGLSFVVGTLLHLARRWTGVSLAGTLPATAWARPLENDMDAANRGCLVQKLAQPAKAWRALQDSNLRPTAPEAVALSS